DLERVVEVDRAGDLGTRSRGRGDRERDRRALPRLQIDRVEVPRADVVEQAPHVPGLRTDGGVEGLGDRPEAGARRDSRGAGGRVGPDLAGEQSPETGRKLVR